MSGIYNWVFVISFIFLTLTILIPYVNDDLNEDFNTINQTNNQENVLDYFSEVELNIYERGFLGFGKGDLIDSINTNDVVNQNRLFDNDEGFFKELDLTNNGLRIRAINQRSTETFIYELIGVVNETGETIEDDFNVELRPFILTAVRGNFVGNDIEEILIDTDQVNTNNSNSEGVVFSNVYTKTFFGNLVENNRDNFFGSYINGISNMPDWFNTFYFGLLITMISFIGFAFVRGVN
ncbi:MAG: hypothetical protein ACLFVR_15710 [Thiohalospira sp.]